MRFKILKGFKRFHNFSLGCIPLVLGKVIIITFSVTESFGDFNKL